MSRIVRRMRHSVQPWPAFRWPRLYRLLGRYFWYVCDNTGKPAHGRVLRWDDATGSLLLEDTQDKAYWRSWKMRSELFGSRRKAKRAQRRLERRITDG